MKAVMAQTVPELKAELLKRHAVLTGKEKKGELQEKLKAVMAAENGTSEAAPSSDAAAPSSAIESSDTPIAEGEPAEVTAVDEAMADAEEPADAADEAAPAAEADAAAGEEEEEAAPAAAADAAMADAEPAAAAVTAAAAVVPAAAVTAVPTKQAAAAAKKAAALAAKPVEVDYGPEEWETAASIPDCWRPRPILRVKGLLDDTTVEQVTAAFADLGVEISHVVIEEMAPPPANPNPKNTPAKPKARSALVRLPAPPLSWCVTPEVLKTHPLDSMIVKTVPVAAAAADAAAEPAAAVKAEPAAEADVKVEAAEEEVKAEDEDAEPAATAAAEETKPAAGEDAAAAAALATALTAVVVPGKAGAAAGKAGANGKGAANSGNTPKAAKGPKAPFGHVDIPKDDGRKEGDVIKVARYYAARITNVGLVVAGTRMAVEAAAVQTTLFLGSLPDDDEDKLRAQMEAYGPVERCFVMRNATGQSKGYGFVEFSQVLHTTKALTDLDAIFKKANQEVALRRFERKKAVQNAAAAVKVAAVAAKAAAAKAAVAPAVTAVAAEAVPPAEDAEMAEGAAVKTEDAAAAPESNGVAVKAEDAAVKEEGAVVKAAGEANGAPAKVVIVAPPEAQAVDDELEQPQVLRAELANKRTIISLFARNLYVANVQQGLKDDTLFRSTFAAHGPLSSCQVAKGPQGTSRGFAFVEYKRSDHAEAAFRALNGVSVPHVGKLLIISFVNPAKERRTTMTPLETTQLAQQQAQLLARQQGRAVPYARLGGPNSFAAGRGAQFAAAAFAGGRGQNFQQQQAFNAGMGFMAQQQGYGPQRGGYSLPRGGGNFGTPVRGAGGGYGVGGGNFQGGRGGGFQQQSVYPQHAPPPPQRGAAFGGRGGGGGGGGGGGYAPQQTFNQQQQQAQAQRQQQFQGQAQGNNFGGGGGGYGVQQASYAAPAQVNFGQAQTGGGGYGGGAGGYGQQASVANAGYSVATNSGYGVATTTGGGYGTVTAPQNNYGVQQQQQFQQPQQQQQQQPVQNYLQQQQQQQQQPIQNYLAQQPAAAVNYNNYGGQQQQQQQATYALPAVTSYSVNTQQATTGYAAGYGVQAATGYGAQAATGYGAAVAAPATGYGAQQQQQQGGYAAGAQQDFKRMRY